MSQKTRILELLRAYPEGLTCARLSQEGLYHHGSQRIGELKKEGHIITFEPGETWEKGVYRLKEGSGDVSNTRVHKTIPPKFELEDNQWRFA